MVSPAGAPPAARTAASRYGWNNLVARDDFTGSSLDASWRPYDSRGHAGKGIRSPGQITLSSGVLRITGTAAGTTGGMAWDHPQKYGRWETRARLPAGCGCYHPVLILWPVDRSWPVGGEIDYAEVTDPSRQTLKFFQHYGADNSQLRGSRQVDMTRWHNFAVEWTSDHVTGYLDGDPFFHTTQRNALPPGPMKQTIQLDWFPGATKAGAIMEVDWVTIYRL
jgi:licheninase